FTHVFARLLRGALRSHSPPTAHGLVVAIAGIGITLVALQGFGFVMAALGLHWKQPYAVAMIMSPVLILLSGMTFPASILPAWLLPFSQAIPLTHGLRIVRDAILLDRSFVDLAPAFLWLAVT